MVVSGPCLSLPYLELSQQDSRKGQAKGRSSEQQLIVAHGADNTKPGTSWQPQACANMDEKAQHMG